MWLHSKFKAKDRLPQQRGRQILSVSPEREETEAEAKLKEFTPQKCPRQQQDATVLVTDMRRSMVVDVAPDQPLNKNLQTPPTLRPWLNPCNDLRVCQSFFYFLVSSPDVEGLDSEASGTKGTRLHMSPGAN